MAKVNLSLPKMDAESLSSEQAIQKIVSYLFQLNEQLRYELTHIDENNMSSSDNEEAGLSMAQIRKAIAEEIKAQGVDLSGNETIRQMQAEINGVRGAQEKAQKNLENNYYWLSGRLKTLTNAYGAHTHQITIDGSGNISMGGPTDEAANPNIADTAFFQNAVAAARPDTGNPPTMVLTSSDIAALSNGGDVTKNIIVRGIDGYGVVLPVNVMAVGV